MATSAVETQPPPRQQEGDSTMTETRFETRPARSPRASRTRLLFAAAILLVPIAVWAAPRAAASSPGNPLADISRSEADLAPVSGTVEERLPAGGYTYLAVRREDGTLVWTVTMGAGARVGDRVDVRSFGRKTSFVSRRLHRTFPELVFGLVSRRP
jgi:hypothetical protein